MSLHAVRKINETIRFIMQFFIYFFLPALSESKIHANVNISSWGLYSRQFDSLLAAGLIFPCPLGECTKRTQRFFLRVLSQSEKTFPPSVAFQNRKLFTCDAHWGSCSAQCLVSPRTGPLHWGSRVAAAKNRWLPIKKLPLAQR